MAVSTRPISMADGVKQRKSGMEMIPVEGSANIAAIGYDAETQRMRVRFFPERRVKSGTMAPGATYEVQGISREVYEEFLAAKSKGAHFHKHFRKNPDYNFVRLAEEAVDETVGNWLGAGVCP